MQEVVLDAYMVFMSWDDLYQAVDRLISLRSQYASEIQPSVRLPMEYDVALCHFSFSVDQLVESTLYLYKTALTSSPSLREHYASCTHTRKGDAIKVIIKSDSRKKDKFRWHLEQLFMQDQVSLYGFEVLSDDVERMLIDPGNRADRERVSPYVASLLSDLSLLGEIRRQLGLLWPGERMREPITYADQQEAFLQRMELNGRLKKAFDGGILLSAVWTPLKKSTRPSNKPLNANSTKILQEAEENLDCFWNAVDGYILEHGGTSLHTKLSNIISFREIRRTPDWTDVGSEFKVSDKASDVLLIKTMLLELEARTEKTVSQETQQLPAQKIKTRGAASQSNTALELAQEDTPEQLAPQPLIKVSKQGFQVFSTLFHNPDDGQSPGEISWVKFQSAMASVGFSIRKLNGSACVFEPLSDEFHRSIIFHEPHPNSNIPFQVARRYGRRLERAYGWTLASFVRR